MYYIEGMMPRHTYRHIYPPTLLTLKSTDAEEEATTQTKLHLQGHTSDDAYDVVICY